jgi:hypothetical protein
VDQRASLGFIGAYLRTLKNKTFMLVVLAFLVASLFESIGFSIFPFLIGFWYYQGDMQAMNNNLLWIMMPLFFVSFPAVWFWTVLSRRIGKKPAILAGAAASAITIALHYPMITPYHPDLIWIVMILFGWAIASMNFLISALVPDIVDEEELATGGVRREGSFFGMQSFVSKLGRAQAGRRRRRAEVSSASYRGPPIRPSRRSTGSASCSRGSAPPDTLSPSCCFSPILSPKLACTRSAPRSMRVDPGPSWHNQARDRYHRGTIGSLDGTDRNYRRHHRCERRTSIRRGTARAIPARERRRFRDRSPSSSSRWPIGPTYFLTTPSRNLLP